MDISMTVVWLVIAVILAAVELSTFGLVSVWFAIGAVFALIVSAFGAGFWTQLIVFIIVSAVVMVTVRPLATKYVNNHTKKTNIDAVIGRKLIVKSDIDNIHGTGKVDMDGSTWLAVSSDDNVVIHAGEEVHVVQVNGAKLVVEREVI